MDRYIFLDQMRMGIESIDRRTACALSHVDRLVKSLRLGDRAQAKEAELDALIELEAGFAARSQLYRLHGYPKAAEHEEARQAFRENVARVLGMHHCGVATDELVEAIDALYVAGMKKSFVYDKNFAWWLRDNGKSALHDT